MHFQSYAFTLFATYYHIYDMNTYLQRIYFEDVLRSENMKTKKVFATDDIPLTMATTKDFL